MKVFLHCDEAGNPGTFIHQSLSTILDYNVGTCLY